MESGVEDEALIRERVLPQYGGWSEATMTPLPGGLINRTLLLDTINERTVRESGIFSWPAIDRALRAHLERRANLGYHLWGLLVLFLWMKHWGIEPAQKTSRVLAAEAIPELVSLPA